MMTQMTPQQVRVVDPVLSQVALGYRHPEHVGMALFPRVPVQVSGGQILEFGKESFRLYNSLRAPGAATKRVQLAIRASRTRWPITAWRGRCRASICGRLRVGPASTLRRVQCAR